MPKRTLINSSGDVTSVGEASAVAAMGAVAGGAKGVVSVFRVSGTAMTITAVGEETLSRVDSLPEGCSIVAPDTTTTLG